MVICISCDVGSHKHYQHTGTRSFYNADGMRDQPDEFEDCACWCNDEF